MNNPYYYSNKRGIATAATTAVVATTEAVTLTMPKSLFYGKWYQGIIFVEVMQEIPENVPGQTDTTPTAALPVIISVNGENRPLVTAEGASVQASDLSYGGVYQVYYDKVRNRLQLM